VDRFLGLTPLSHASADREVVIEKLHEATQSIDPGLVSFAHDSIKPPKSLGSGLHIFMQGGE
jgi:hypothetical protein